MATMLEVGDASGRGVTRVPGRTPAYLSEAANPRTYSSSEPAKLGFSAELRLVDKTYTDTHNESQDSGRQVASSSPILTCVAPLPELAKSLARECKRSSRYFIR